RWRWPVSIIGVLAIAAMLVLPMAALTTTSLVPTYGVRLSLSTITLDNYVEVLGRQAATVRAFFNSFYLAGFAALILAFCAVPLALGLRRVPRRSRHLLHGLLDLPYAL